MLLFFFQRVPSFLLLEDAGDSFGAATAMDRRYAKRLVIGVRRRVVFFLDFSSLFKLPSFRERPGERAFFVGILRFLLLLARGVASFWLATPLNFSPHSEDFVAWFRT